MNMKRHAFRWIVTAVACTMIYACGGGVDSSIEITKGLLIQNATVVNTLDGSLATGMSLVIDNGKITETTGDRTHIGGTAQLIDAAGKYVVPAFLDMYTHWLDSPVEEQAAVAQLFIANGITGIREMRGALDLVQRAQALNAESAAGRLDAPEIRLISGETIGLNAPPAAAISALAAIQEVQNQKGYGVGFIKNS
jgi:imidazolonepropionase-like amidohydrolase